MRILAGNTSKTVDLATLVNQLQPKGYAVIASTKLEEGRYEIKGYTAQYGKICASVRTGL